MLSLDTNIIVYALNTRMSQHPAALAFVKSLANRQDVVICELTLVEVYLLIRNPTVFPRPFDAVAAVEVINRYRANPNWRLIECQSVMDRTWRHASKSGFGRRQIIDARLALTLRAAGVRQLATANAGHFEDYGFERVWDPTSTGNSTVG